MMTGNEIRVLITDDKRPARRGLKALLARIPKIKVVGEAANGLEALSLTEKVQPDVVLMDVQMTVMDGLEATRLIKSRWPKIRVIALTIYPQYRQQALAAGADRFLLKGSSFESLEQAILGPSIQEQGVIDEY